MENTVEIRGLRKDYKGFSLEDVSFDVPQGYIMGLIGPNGAGKTTVIKLVMNLIRRRAGEIKVFGLDNLRHEPEVKSRIGFVYDAPRFPEDLRLKDIASALAPFYGKWDGRLFDSLAAEFELPLTKTFRKLSHGMKMKFSLAIALSHDADLVLMDEPTAGLDPQFRFELLERLQALIQNEQKTVLFSSHITTDLERVADHITFIHKGRIVFSSPKDEILEHWGIVKASVESFSPGEVPGLRGFRRTDYSAEALTSDLAGARSRFGGSVVYDKATLEDIMYFISKGNGHV
jgi:ABC-2 type transport system ATP-binding protein